MQLNGRILVTGAAGFTGGALARRLAADGHLVRGTARPGSDVRALEEAGIEVFFGDIADPNATEEMMKGCSFVFHIAALFRRAGVPDAEYERVNIEGTRLLLDAAAACGVTKFVHCSTIGVCGHIANPPANEKTPYNPGDIYQQTKMEGEKLAISRFMDSRPQGVVVRPASIYGPGDLRLLKMFKMISRRRFLVIGSGKPTFHVVYIDDLVEGFLLAMQKEVQTGETFIIAGNEYVPLNELFRLVAEAVGAAPPKWRVPVWPVQLLATLVEKVCIPFRIEPPIYRRRVDFFTKSRAFDISKAKHLLDYEPKVSLKEGMQRTADWYRAEGLL